MSNATRLRDFVIGALLVLAAVLTLALCTTHARRQPLAVVCTNGTREIVVDNVVTGCTP